jgi:hypothetical protein
VGFATLSDNPINFRLLTSSYYYQQGTKDGVNQEQGLIDMINGLGDYRKGSSGFEGFGRDVFSVRCDVGNPLKH